jgi:hypothetical protein
MIKIFLSIWIFLFTNSVFSQNEEIYKLTFSDKSNFELMTNFGKEIPKKIFILDTTQQWNSRRFWLENVDLKSAKVLKEIERDDHHPYHHSYLFKDSQLDKLIIENEKLTLSKNSVLMKPKRIHLKGKNFSTIPSAKHIRGFYIITSEPILTSNKKYAFIDLEVLHKNSKNDELNDSYFGSICVIYERQKNNKWKKIKVVNHLIL